MTGALILALTMAWGNRRRHLLAVMTLALGLVGLVTVAAASTTMTRAIEYQALLRDGRPVTAAVSLTSAHPDDVTASRDRIRSMLGAAGSASLTVDDFAAQITDPADLLDAHVVFTDAELREARGWPLVAGRWLDESAATTATAVANTAAVARGAAVGARLELAGTRVVVVRGAVDDGRDDAVLYLRLDQAGARQWTESTAARILVTDLRLDVPRLLSQVRLADDIAGVSLVDTVQRVDSLDALRKERQATETVFVFVALFSVLALIVGIVNVGLATLRERALELSLRRALGVSRPMLAAAMVIEAQVVGLAASVVAVAASSAVYPWLLDNLTTLPGVQAASYPGEAAVGAVVVGLLSCTAGSVVPVARMWRMPMSVVMRQ